MPSAPRPFRSRAANHSRLTAPKAFAVLALGLCRCSSSFEAAATGVDGGNAVDEPNEAAPTYVAAAPDAGGGGAIADASLLGDAITEPDAVDAGLVADASVNRHAAEIVASPVSMDGGLGALVDAGADVASDVPAGSKANPAATIGQGLAMAKGNE